MTVRIDGTNSTANPAITGADTDTGLQLGTDEIQFVTGGTNRATVESDGDFTVEQGDLNLSDGNLVVASGHGIDFSADGNAAGMTDELLDDYEEGTWTPEISDAVSGGNTASLTTADGIYTKVGRSVTVAAYISCNNVSALTNGSTCTLLGFPFTAISFNNVEYNGACTFSLIDVTSNNACVSVRIRPGGTNGTLIESKDNLGRVNIPCGSLSNTTFLSFTLTYFTA